MSAVESAVAEATRTAALPVTQRVAIALQSAQTEKDLKELAEKHRDIVAVTNKDGREQAHRAYMTLKTARVEIEKRGKQAREDATAFSKAVIAEEKRLVGLIEPEESRLQKLRDDYDDEQERIRKEAEEKERARVAAIQQEIAAIRQYVPVANGRNAESIAEYIERCRATPLTEELFAEWLGEAQSAHAETMAELERMHAARVEQDRIEAEVAEERRQQEERERQEREAEAQRQREEAERLAAREREIEAERRRMREEQAERDRQEAERQEQLRREQEARDREEAERQARIREEEERIALQRRELEQERACNQALAALADSVAQAERAVDASACRALLEAVDATPVTDETYGAFAQSLRAAAQAAALRIENRMIELTPPPAAAGELTSAAVPSPPAVDPATPAAGEVDEEQDATDLPAHIPPYPGHDEIVNAVSTHFQVSAAAAVRWLNVWAEGEAA